MTGTSRIYQDKGAVNGSGNRGGRRADLRYLEHLGRGRDHLIETIDRVSCGLIVSKRAGDSMEGKLTEFDLNIADEEDCFFLGRAV